MYVKIYSLHIIFDESFVSADFVNGLLYLNLHPSDDLLVDVKKLLYVIPVHELIPLLLHSLEILFTSLFNLDFIGCASSTCGLNLVFFVLILARAVIVDIEAIRWVDKVIVVPFLALKHYLLCVVSMILFFF